jgi:hypothetical protein
VWRCCGQIVPGSCQGEYILTPCFILFLMKTHGMPGESRKLEMELDDADRVELRPM